MQLRPTPTFTIISQALPQQATYMRKLILKQSLDALILGLTLAVKVLRRGLHQGLWIRNLLRLTVGELQKLPVNLCLVLHQRLHLTNSRELKVDVLLHNSRPVNKPIKVSRDEQISACRDSA